MTVTRSAARFRMGRLVITRGASVQLTSDDVLTALRRHLDGDWGDLCEEDRGYNDEALETGERLLSAYFAGNRTRFYVITEWDRSATTILLPEEY